MMKLTVFTCGFEEAFLCGLIVFQSRERDAIQKGGQKNQLEGKNRKHFTTKQ